MADVQAVNAADYDIEPYVGMPIYFDDEGTLMGFGRKNSCIVSDRTTADCKPENSGSVKPGNQNNQNVQSTVCPKDFETWPLAMAYVPWQSFNKTYSPEDGFKAGTVFPELDLPFLGGGRR